LTIVWTIAKVLTVLFLFAQLNRIINHISSLANVLVAVSNRESAGLVKIILKFENQQESVDVYCNDGTTLDNVKVEDISDDDGVVTLRRNDGKSVLIPVFNISFIIRGDFSTQLSDY